jgi:multiple sugar transport system permease protein
VLIALLTCLPAGYALAVYHVPGRRPILDATLVMMLVPSAALVLPLFLEVVNLRLVNTPWSVILPLGLFPFGVSLSFLYCQSEVALAALLTAAPILVIFMFAQRALVARQVSGAVKK